MVKEGKISEVRINQSVEKILRLKDKYCEGEIDVTHLAPTAAVEEAKALSVESVSLVKNSGVLPFKKEDKVLILFPEIRLFSLVDNENQKYKTLSAYYPKDEIIFNRELNNLAFIKETAVKYDKIILATYNVSKEDYQAKLFDCLDKEKTVVVSLRSPYDMIQLSNVKNYICLYEATPLSLSSLAKCLLGEAPFTGKVPVTW
ncbi:MAG: hypothetical protein PHF85_05575, partial [Bacilli bacterium]|nr:hypothetical protein [Bacilli bacterium]